uniref:MltR family transcriptional regulator n=1 Tax=Gelidibacter sp. TaxID=2018083 RepID=UPI004049437C
MKKKEKEIIKIAAKFQQDLKEGSDRESILMAASFLESELESVLKSKLVGDAAFKYELFDFEEPLGNFSAKIRMCYALGIISKKIMDNLTIIDSLKSVFEQDYKMTTFETVEITERIYSLSTSFYSKYEVAPRVYFCNAALSTLTFVLKGFSVKKFKETIHPEITETEKQEMIKNAEKMANEIINFIQSN